MRELADQRPRFGCRRIAALLRREGWQASVPRMLRLWQRAGLKMARACQRRAPNGHGAAGWAGIIGGWAESGVGISAGQKLLFAEELQCDAAQRIETRLLQAVANEGKSRFGIML